MMGRSDIELAEFQWLPYLALLAFGALLALPFYLRVERRTRAAWAPVEQPSVTVSEGGYREAIVRPLEPGRAPWVVRAATLVSFALLAVTAIELLRLVPLVLRLGGTWSFVALLASSGVALSLNGALRVLFARAAVRLLRREPEAAKLVRQAVALGVVFTGVQIALEVLVWGMQNYLRWMAGGLLPRLLVLLLPIGLLLAASRAVAAPEDPVRASMEGNDGYQRIRDR